MRIRHPRPTLGRTTDLGIDFVDGVAEVETLHPEREAALVQHGYTIEQIDTLGAVPSDEEPGGVAVVDLTTLTIPQLRELVGERDVIPARATKAEAVAIAAALPADPTPGTILVAAVPAPGVPEGGESFLPDGPNARAEAILNETLGRLQQPETGD